MTGDDSLSGLQLPAFDLPTDGGGRAANADFAGRTLVLYLYPKDDTSGCTKESLGFAESYPEFQAAGAEVVGLSKDGVKESRQVQGEIRSALHPARRRGQQPDRSARRLGGKEHVRPEIHGHGPLHLPGRQGRRHPEGLAQGQG